MQEIVELVKEVFIKRIPKIELLQDDAKSKKTLYYKIYDAIRQDQIITNEDMAEMVYNDTKNNASYRKLKSRFKERLYNTILFVQPRQSSTKSHMNEVYYCYKYQVIAKLLLTIGAQKSGHGLMKKVLAKAEPLQLYDVVQQCALTLRRSSLLAGNTDDFATYNKLFLDANDKLIAETNAEEFYHQILINFSHSLAPKPSLAPLAKQYINEISVLKEKHNTFLINYYSYNLQIVYYQFIDDFKSAIDICDQYEKFLLSQDLFYTSNRHANMLVVKLDCCLQIRNYSEGTNCAEKAFNFYPEGIDNWFVLMELYFLLSFNTYNIEKALEIYLKATGHSRFENLQPQSREIWSIYGGYLSFLLHYNEEYQESLNLLTKHKPEFKFSRLINEIPIYAKDKKGLNVAVIILQILILLQNKNYLQISKRTEALYQYTYRNLNKDDAYRSHYFIKMLIAMEKTSFKYAETIRKTEPYLEKMKKENVQYSASQTRMEIIPYEDLWSIILDLLKRN